MVFYTEKNNFYMGHKPEKLVETYGSPLYVYNEDILRGKLRELKNLVNHKSYIVNYSPKANGNIGILQIVKNEGVHADAMSPGEVALNEKAGFTKEDIFYVSNNMTQAEMKFVIEKDFYVSLDSVDQLEMYAALNPGSSVSIRVNTGFGIGHHQKVITAGKETKFGISMDNLALAKEVAETYKVKITGLNQHLGSLFLTGDTYVKSIKTILDLSLTFKDVHYIDFGGGFGVPYHRNENELPLDLEDLSKQMNEIINAFVKENTEKEYTFAIEPGRYVVAEAGILLGEVTSVKYNEDKKFIGTNIGFNNNMRPVLYDAYHEVEIYSQHTEMELASVSGNICESGDILAKDRLFPKAAIKDIVAMLDAGAYGSTMASNYNQRLRPAELLIRSDGELVLLRERDTIEEIVAKQIPLKNV